MSFKLVNSSKLTPLVKSLKKKNKKIVFTNGCFDLIHPGHIKLFKEAKKQGDVLILGLNSDSSIRKIKGRRRPILSQKSRVEILTQISCIDYIVIFSQSSPLELIKKIKPDVLVKGGDWTKDKIIGRDIVEAQGGKVVRVKLKKGYSTTELFKRIKKL